MRLRFLRLAILAFAAALFTAAPAHAQTVRRAVELPDPRVFAGQALRVLYVTDIYNNSVDIYQAGVRKPKLIGKISVTLPTDLFVDRAGSLYVVGHNPNLLIFFRGHSMPSRVIVLPKNYGPQDITVAADGTIYYTASRQGGSAAVQIDRMGKVERVIRYPESSILTGIATDSHGNLYVADNSDVYVYAPHNVQPYADLKQPTLTGGILIDRTNQLLVGLQYSDKVLVENVTDGRIIRTVTTAGGGDYLALDARQDYLYAVVASQGTLQYYDYRSGRPLGFMVGFHGGIAVDPAAVP